MLRRVATIYSQLALLSLSLLANEVLSDCLDPGIPLNGQRSVTSGGQGSFSVGTVVTFTCDTGFSMTGSTSTTCETMELSSIWSDVTPACNPITCTPPPSDDSNHVTFSLSLTYMSSAVYTCVQGYRYSDNSVSLTSKCTAMNTWTPSQVNCIRISCPVPAVVPKATRQGSEFTFGSRINYSCNTGYRIVSGTASLQCSSSANWIGTYPQCEEIECGSPAEVSNSAASITGTSYRSEATFICSRGYQVTPETATGLRQTCGIDGTWSGPKPVCQGVYCADPGNVTKSSRTSSEDQFTFRFPEKLTYACDKGHVGVFSSTTANVLNCLPSGEWDMLPFSCKVITCRDLSSSSVKAVLIEDRNTYDSVRRYACFKGHEVVQGSLERRCQEDRSYDQPPPVCSPKDCGWFGPIANWNETLAPDANNTLYNAVSIVTCALGHTMTSGSDRLVLLCNEHGNWSQPIPSCRPVSCGEISHSSGSEVVNKSRHFYSDTAEHHCSTGYQWSSGDRRRYCGHDAAWSGEIFKCNRTSCGAYPEIAYTDVTSSGELFEDMANYACSAGYKVDVVPSNTTPSPSNQNNNNNNASSSPSSSSYTLTCQASKQWTGNTPICTPVLCGPPIDIENANWTSTHFYFGGVTRVTCNPGYEWEETSGNLDRLCTAHAFWSKPPLCKRITCDVAESFPGTIYTGPGRRFGDVINYTCAIGHQPKLGPTETPAVGHWSTFECNWNRTWVGNEINCKPVNCGDPGPGENATFTGTSHTYNSVVTFECDLGHRVSDGVLEITCRSDGTWSYPTPRCSLVPGFIPPPTVGKVIKTTDAKNSDMIGAIGLSLVLATFSVMMLIDLPKLISDSRMMKRNLTPLARALKRILGWAWLMIKSRLPAWVPVNSEETGSQRKKKMSKSEMKRAARLNFYAMMQDSQHNIPDSNYVNKRRIIATDG